jgi:hypothetical protein
MALAFQIRIMTTIVIPVTENRLNEMSVSHLKNVSYLPHVLYLNQPILIIYLHALYTITENVNFEWFQ